MGMVISAVDFPPDPNWGNLANFCSQTCLITRLTNFYNLFL